MLVFIACEENPLDDSTIVPESRQITGTVQLSNQFNHSDIYVWLEGFNLSTFTDQEGAFELTLPSTEITSSNGSMNGVFFLYFYIANYAIAQAEVVIQNGQVLPSRGDLDENGRLHGIRTLQKILHIRTSVDPDTVVVSQQDTMYVKVFLQAVYDTVEVSLPKIKDASTGPVMLQGKSSDEVFILDVYGGDTERVIEAIGPDIREWDMAFFMEPGSLPADEYEVIPYFLVLQEGVPTRMIETLGPHAHELTEEFVRIPYRRDGGEFWVLRSF